MTTGLSLGISSPILADQFAALLKGRCNTENENEAIAISFCYLTSTMNGLSEESSSKILFNSFGDILKGILCSIFEILSKD